MTDFAKESFELIIASGILSLAPAEPVPAVDEAEDQRLHEAAGQT